MDLLTILNQKRNDLVKLDDLEIGHKYKIINANKVNTKFGASISIEIIHNNEKVTIFLPKRLSDLSRRQTEELKNYAFTYNGKIDIGMDRLKHDLVFEKLER